MIVSLPDGDEILPDDFSELGAVFDGIKTTKRYVALINKEIAKIEKPLLLMEDTYSEIYKVAWLKIKGISFGEENVDAIFEEKAPFKILGKHGKKELQKYGIKAQTCPFSIIRKDGMIGYIEDGQYVLETPTPFNMELEELSLTGKHNLYNSLAAGISAKIANVKNEVLRESLGNFEGVEHRLEKVTRVRGVEYINDSKATNVDACWYALESMTTPTILILGGKDKGNDYNAIADLVRKKCTGLVFLGADNSKLHRFFDGFGIPIADTHSMKECVEACYKMAKPGDTVLLSPCCASFDLFKNMEDRGEQFKTLVRSL